MIRFTTGFVAGGVVVGAIMMVTAIGPIAAAPVDGRTASLNLATYCQELRKRRLDPNDPRGLYDHTGAFTIYCAPPKRTDPKAR